MYRLRRVYRDVCIGYAVFQDRSDGVMETHLYMKQALLRSFRTYTIAAENNIAISTQTVHLIRSEYVRQS